MKLRENARFSTLCIHAGQEPDPSTGAIITPIYQTSTYVQEALGKHKGYEYARTQNPTRAALEANVAAIEHGRAGFAFASGMAAEGAIMTLLKSGDHVVVTDNTYGGTYRLFEQVLRKFQLDFTYVDTSDTGAVAAAFRPATKMLFLETPTNPVLRITDIRAASDIAHAHDACVVVDNTFASPYVQRPLDLGADIVVHSTTKFLNGHSDSIGGVVVAHRDDHIEWLRFIQNAEGAILGPMDALAGAARHQDASDPDGAAQRERDGAGGVSRRPHEGRADALPRLARSPASRARGASDERIRRDYLLPARIVRERTARC